LGFEPERFVDVDDERVLVLVRVHATGTGSGVPVDLRNAHEFTIRDGVLVRFKVYGDRDEALADAGLSK
jgi:hypothetical protein